MARKRFQTGSVFLRGGKWVARWREDVIRPGSDVPFRVRRAEVLGTLKEYPTKRLAARALQTKLARINAVDYRPGRVATVREFADIWRERVVANLKPSTQVTVSSHLKIHILPALGKLSLDQLGPENQQALIGRLAGKVSRKTLLNILGTLSSMLNRARDWKYACEGVCLRNLSIPKRGTRQPARMFTAEECARILRAAKEPYRTMYAIAAKTGMRAGEIMGLRVDDVDLARRTIRIEQSVWRGKVQTPKNEGSKSELPIPESLARDLRRHMETWKPNPQRLLFINWRRRPYSGDSVVQKHLIPLLDELKIPHGGFHAFRHMHSSLLVGSGASIKVAQDQLRHSDPRITLGIYSHAIDDSQRAAVENIAAILDSVGLKDEMPTQRIQ